MEERYGVGLELKLGISLGGVEEVVGLGVGCKVMGSDVVVVEAWFAVLMSLAAAHDGRWHRVLRSADAAVQHGHEHARSDTVERCHDITAVVDGSDDTIEGGARA